MASSSQKSVSGFKRNSRVSLGTTWTQDVLVAIPILHVRGPSATIPCVTSQDMENSSFRISVVPTPCG
jgi:hypothetical protein